MEIPKGWWEKKFIKKPDEITTKNCLSYWFPILKKTGVKIPKTVFWDMDKADPNFVRGMKRLFWMEEPNKEEVEAFNLFRRLLEKAGDMIGYPIFLRSGQLSNKHDWKDSCFVEKKESLMSHVQAIAEFSIMVDMKGGLPINVWVVREIIASTPGFYFFNNMPITTEMRFFFNDGKVICYHPYWPQKAFKNCKDIKSKLDKLYSTVGSEIEGLIDATEGVAQSFRGYWSLDWLRAKSGEWFAIDMAIGESSYHYPGCNKEILIRRDK